MLDVVALPDAVGPVDLDQIMTDVGLEPSLPRCYVRQTQPPNRSGRGRVTPTVSEVDGRVASGAPRGPL
jgi:hypothetical protein